MDKPLAPTIAPTINPNSLQTVIAGTALAAQNQTQVAYILIDTLTPTLSANITLVTESPLSLTYEGLSASCICNACSCLTNIIFTVRVTVDSQGYVRGVLEKYTPDSPAIEFEGTKTSLHGLFQDEKNKLEFIGSLSDNLSTLDGALSFEGTYEDGTLYSGKRTMILFRK